MYPQFVFSNRFNRKRPPSRNKTRWKRPQPNRRFEKLEDRVLLAADCYANLFSGPRLADMDSNESEVLKGVFNALLPSSHVDFTAPLDSSVTISDSLFFNRTHVIDPADLDFGTIGSVMHGELSPGDVYRLSGSGHPEAAGDAHQTLVEMQDLLP